VVWTTNDPDDALALPVPSVAVTVHEYVPGLPHVMLPVYVLPPAGLSVGV
jgi:hypothetical protein